MMARTQITLEPELQRRVRKRAAESGISMAEYVRRLVSRDLGTPKPAADVSAVFDLGRSDGTDIARNKDAMVAGAFAATRKLRRK
jgi:hypothetical protein